MRNSPADKGSFERGVRLGVQPAFFAPARSLGEKVPAREKGGSPRATRGALNGEKAWVCFSGGPLFSYIWSVRCHVFDFHFFLLLRFCFAGREAPRGRIVTRPGVGVWLSLLS